MRGHFGCEFFGPHFGGFDYVCRSERRRWPWPGHHGTGFGRPSHNHGHHDESPDRHGPFHGLGFGPRGGPHHGPPGCDTSPHHHGNEQSPDRRRSWRGPHFEMRGGRHHGPPGCGPHYHHGNEGSPDRHGPGFGPRGVHQLGPSRCCRPPRHHGNDGSPDRHRPFHGCGFGSRGWHGPPRCGKPRHRGDQNPDETNGHGTDSEGPECSKWVGCGRSRSHHRGPGRCHRRRNGGCGYRSDRSPSRRERSCHRGKGPHGHSRRCHNQPCCADNKENEVVISDGEDNGQRETQDKGQNTDQTVLVQRIVVERAPRPSSI